MFESEDFRGMITEQGLSFFEVRSYVIGDRTRIGFLFYTDVSLRHLTDHGNEMVYLDGTFNIAEAGLVLHTFGVRHSNSKKKKMQFLFF